MGYAHLTRHLDVSPERAFTFVTDAHQLTRWLEPLTEVHPTTDRLDHVGAKFDARLDVAGHHLETTWEVTRVEVPRYVRVAGIEQGGDSTAEVWIECGAWRGGCEFELQLQWSFGGGFLERVTDLLVVERSVRAALERSMDHLATALGTTAGPVTPDRRVGRA